MEKSLFHIKQEYLELADQLADDELTESLEMRLKINEAELKIKTEGYIQVIKKLDAESVIIDTEVKRLQGLKKSRQTALKRLKGAIVEALMIYDVKKLELPLHTVSLRRSESVQINCAIDELPSWAKKIKVEPDKILLKKTIKAGEEVQGVEIKENYSLNIK